MDSRRPAGAQAVSRDLVAPCLTHGYASCGICAIRELETARAVVEAIRRQRTATETWATHMRACSLCADYYTEETGLCEVGAALVRAIPDWTETDAALAAHDAAVTEH